MKRVLDTYTHFINVPKLPAQTLMFMKHKQTFKNNRALDSYDELTFLPRMKRGTSPSRLQKESWFSPGIEERRKRKDDEVRYAVLLRAVK